MPKAPESTAWLTIPNALTLLRLALIVPFAWLASQGRDAQALGVFVLAGLTDVADGAIARRLGQASKIGRLIDPLVDKLMTGAAYLVLALFRAGLPALPWWLLAAVLARDALILAGSAAIYALRRNSGFQPSWLGKLNTFVEIGVVVCFLASTDWIWILRLLPLTYGLLLVTLLGSTAGYAQTGLRMLRRPAREPAKPDSVPLTK